RGPEGHGHRRYPRRLDIDHAALSRPDAPRHAAAPEEGAEVTTPNHRIRLVMELRASGVTDTRVLAAIERVPREAFAPPQFRDQAYETTALPIGQGQPLSQPSVVAMMSQALDIAPRMKVLEIGTGSGYQTAILAKLARRVYTIERHKPLLVDAEARLRKLR